MITTDYNSQSIEDIEYGDLYHIGNVELSNLRLDEYDNLLVFPDSFSAYDKEFGKKVICMIDESSRKLYTNSIVGFVGRNSTRLSIHSRFAAGEKDYFLHYMLQRVAKINLFNLSHSTTEDQVFDFLFYLFPHYLKRAVSQGVFRQYVTNRYNDAKVKGVIDLNRHLKSNIPFRGSISYNAREYSADNVVTQLVRHTIECLSKTELGSTLLNCDLEIQNAVSLIRMITPKYNPSDLYQVVNKNLKTVSHPFYTEYAPLQKLCVQILKHSEIKYGQGVDEIYGVLIDAAWLWEEYIAILIQDKYYHYYKDRGPRFNLFENFQQIIPDYISISDKVIADAKYIPLNRESRYFEEKATSIYYKTITYMYRFCSHKAYLFYPISETETCKLNLLKIKTDSDGVNGGTIIKHGLRIPQDASSFADFVVKMELNERVFLDSL